MLRKRPLDRYEARRDFSVTPEPRAGGTPQPDALAFVVQKHWATRLHYDFRLELDGVMKSWAVPKGPSYDPADKRMAVHVEDHPIAYNRFEGRIPAQQYGAGKVIIWDKGTWLPVGDPHKGYRAGKLSFELHGHKLHGLWALVRMRSREGRQDAWLLIKERDGYAKSAGLSVVDEFPDSVAKIANAAPGLQVRPARPARPAGRARRLALPATLSPVLATLVDAPPPDPANWLFEVKFDGYRILARIDARGVRLFTRNGHDWSRKLPHLVRDLKSMRLAPGWLDGEIVVRAADGKATSFQALQQAFDAGGSDEIEYFVFDLPWYDGRDLTGEPLTARRALLRSLLEHAPAAIRFSDEFAVEPAELLATACKLGLEGVIGKRRESLYGSRRTPDWIKLKCSQRQEFVIGGWTEPQGSRSGLGALLLGVHDEAGALRYAGKVGTGFDERTLEALARKLERLGTRRRPFTGAVTGERKAHWVRPSLVAEVSFSEWTGDGHLRHPVFHALRTDKPAKSIVRESPQHAPAGTRAAAPVRRAADALPAGLRVTHPERVIDASTGITKLELLHYYRAVGALMMPHLLARPASLLRTPAGIDGAQFFQKHAERMPMKGVATLDRKLDPGHAPLLEIASPLGLLSAAQMNVVEFHTWNALRTDILHPDRITFDLDPGECVGWPDIRKAAEVLHGFLAELGLSAFVKTSGGKGLHVVAPIRRKHAWETVKGFSRAVVERMAETVPALFVAKSGAKNRVGRIFIDDLRNGFGATTACAWSARARPGLGISVPLEWGELAEVGSSSHWTIRNAAARFDIGNAPWRTYSRSARPLEAAMKALGLPTVKLARR
jgi:bifunctional non-homologous end joining protein LigD